MELLKRTIKQALTTGTTESCTGTCRVIIPDLSVIYHLTFLLTAEKHDLGFFDALIQGALGEGDVILTRQQLFEYLSGVTAPPTTTTTTTAAPVVKTIPSVTTGDWDEATAYFDAIINNIITGDGNDTVTEYGFLDTTNATYGTESQLVYENNTNSNVGLKSFPFTVPSGDIPKTFGSKLGEVPDGTTVYFRAFARNSIGIGYGLVKSHRAGLLPVI